MNYQNSYFQAKWPTRLRAAFEIVMVSGLVSSFASGFLVSFVFAVFRHGRNGGSLLEMGIEALVMYQMLESAITFLILWKLMEVRRETFAMLGLRWKQWKTNVLLGILAVPCLIILSVMVNLVFRFFLPEYFLEKNPLMEMIHSPQHLALFIFTVILAGGIKEELQRAFILRRFHHLGGTGIGLVVWSLVFGAGHYMQGPQAICGAAVLGFVFGVLYLIRGNLIPPMVAHSAYNAMTLLIYWFVIGMNE